MRPFPDEGDLVEILRAHANYMRFGATVMRETTANYCERAADELERLSREKAAMIERERIKAILIAHEPLAGAYVHDLIRAIDEGTNDR